MLRVVELDFPREEHTVYSDGIHSHPLPPSASPRLSSTHFCVLSFIFLNPLSPVCVTYIFSLPEANNFK